MQAHRSDGGSQTALPIVKLQRAHRDAIRDFIKMDLESDALAHYVECDDKDEARAFVAQLSLCLRLLDELGWHADDPRDEFELLLDPDTFRLLNRYAASARRCIEDELNPRYGEPNYEAETIDGDLDAIHAAKLAEAALEGHESIDLADYRIERL